MIFVSFSSATCNINKDIKVYFSNESHIEVQGILYYGQAVFSSS